MPSPEFSLILQPPGKLLGNMCSGSRHGAWGRAELCLGPELRANQCRQAPEIQPWRRSGASCRFLILVLMSYRAISLRSRQTDKQTMLRAFIEQTCWSCPPPRHTHTHTLPDCCQCRQTYLRDLILEGMIGSTRT